MILIKVENNTIEKALKNFKKKFDTTKVLKELRERKEFKKRSVKIREAILKAKYKESLLEELKYNES